MAGKQFDAAAFLEFCRGKPADEEYNFCHHAQCALGQFGFSVHGWSDKDIARAGVPLDVFHAATKGNNTFGALADRLANLGQSV